MTGKQIIESATEESDGMWKPSAGLVYPLLGRLLQEGLIEENDEGKYTITKKGISVLEDLQSIQDVIKKQMDVLMRLGNVGRFVAMDILDRVTSMAATLNDNLDNMTKAQRDQYKKFLQGTLKKLDEKEGKQKVNVE